MRNRRRQWTEKSAFSTQYLQIPHTFVALPASVSSSCALSFSGSYPSAPLSNICIRQFCTPSTHRIYTWYISVLQQNIVFNINKLYGRKKKSHINKRWTWINFSVNILIVQENQWTFSNTLSGSKGTCKKKKKFKKLHQLLSQGANNNQNVRNRFWTFSSCFISKQSSCNWSVSVHVYSNWFTKQMVKVVPLVSAQFLSQDVL